MKNLFKSFLYSAIVLIAGAAVSCTETDENAGGYQGIPTIEVTPASVSVALAGGTTEAVTVNTPATWTLDIDTDGVTASTESGNGEGNVTFTVPATDQMRSIKVTFTATGYVSGYPITKKASLTIIQSDSDLPTTGEFIYSDNCGESVSKVDGYWPYVDKYTGWAPKGGEGIDQSGVTYTGKDASVRNSGKAWAPVGATYATDAPYAYISKAAAYFQINEIKLKAGVKNYTFTFTAFNQYASLIASPYTPAPITLESGKNMTLYVGLDGENWAPVTYSTMADGNWTYVVAPFTLPQEADKIYVRFADYKADTSTALPSSEYQYQAACRLDDFTLTEGGNGPVLEIGTGGGGGGQITEGTIEQILAAGEGTYTLKNAWVVATYARGFLLTDSSSKYILCYQGTSGTVPAVGTVVEVSGEVTSYAGLLQFADSAKVTATSETKSVDLGTPKALTGADLDKYVSSPSVQYASFEGALAISGNYYNVTIEGASTAIGSISYPDTDMAAKLKALNGKGIKATGFMIGVSSGKYTNMMITAVEGTGADPDPLPTPDPVQAGLISNVANLKAGNYIMSAFLDVYEDNDWSANPYHCWTGTVTGTESSNSDLATVDYSYKNSTLTPANGVVTAAAVITLEAVDGKTNTYYIKSGDQYLKSAVSATNRRLVLSADKAEWVATDNEKGGITLSNNSVYLGSARASSNHLRSYKAESTLEHGVYFFAPGGTTPDPEPDPDPDPTPGEITTIAEILALGSNATINSAVIEGVVISNMALNNLTSKKGLYVQDETGALQFYLAANHEFAFGTKVKMDLSGAKLGEYNGAVQISGLALDKITVVSTNNTVEAKKVSIADFLANKHEGQYIAIEGVQVVSDDLAKTWVVGDNHTSINMEDAAGNKFVVFSSKYSTYGDQTVAQGSGTIKGISSISKGAIQIIFTQESDFANLTGTRFNGGTTPDPEPEPTVGVAINTITSAGNYTATGTVVAVGAQAYIIADNTGAMMVYHKDNGRTVGENITISGDVTIYTNNDGTSFGTPQFNSSATVTVNSTGNTWSYNPTVLDGAGVEALMSETMSKEVQFNGALSISGNYVNVALEGVSVQGSVKYIDNSLLSEFNGKNVTIKGYYVGVSSNKYVNVLPYSVTEIGGGATPDPDPEPEPEPEGTAASIVFANAGYENAQVVDGVNIKLDDNVSIVFNQATSSTPPTYYDKSQGIRMYQNGATLDVTANGKTITAIKLEFDYQQWYLAADSGNLSAEADTRTWTGEASSVKFTSTGTDSKHRAYIKAVTVYYK